MLTFEAALDARAQAMADACTRCGKCVEVCPVTSPGGLTAEELKNPAAVIGGVVDIVRTGQVRTDGGNDAARKWANACILSGECIKACDYGVNPRFLLYMARVKMAHAAEPAVQRKNGIDGFRKVAREVTHLSRIQLDDGLLQRLGQGQKQTSDTQASEQSPPDFVFYTGCNVLKTPHIALLALDIMDAVAGATELLRTTPAGHRQRDALLFAELLVRVVVRMRLGGSRRRHAGIGDRLILRQSLPAHLGAARRGRRRVDVVAAEREYRAVNRLGRMLADIAAAHVAREAREVALERRAEAAAAAGAQDIGIARVQDLIERLAVVKALFLLGGETVDRDRIAGTAEPALEAPRLALHPIHLRVETKIVAGLHHLLAAKPAAEAAGAA